MAAAQAEQPSGGAPADTEAASVAWVGQPTRQADGKTFFAGFASGGVEYGLGEHRLHTSALRLSLEAASVRRPAAEAMGHPRRVDPDTIATVHIARRAITSEPECETFERLRIPFRLGRMRDQTGHSGPRIR